MAKRTGPLVIRFKNWDKYNIRRGDLKFPTWFAFDHGMFSDSKLYDLNAEEFLTFIYLLCEASKNNKAGECIISTEHYKKNSRVTDRSPDRVLNRTIDKLASFQIIEQPRVRGKFASIGETSLTDRQTDRQEGAAAVPPALVALWNEHSKQLPKVEVVSAARKKKAEKAWKENPDEAFWVGVINKLTSSPFCCGKNDRGWKADFDFLLKPDTPARAIEGKYDERGTKPQQAHPLAAQMNQRREGA